VKVIDIQEATMQKVIHCGSSVLAIVLAAACSAPSDEAKKSPGNEAIVAANQVSCELPAPNPRAPNGDACPNATFVWDEVPGATHYQLNVLTSTENFLFQVDVGGISYQHPSDLPHGDLSFNVSAFNACGRSPASSRQYFTVKDCRGDDPCGKCFDGFNDCAAVCPGTCERKITCGGASAHKCFC
jgi:hypothetical protein